MAVNVLSNGIVSDSVQVPRNRPGTSCIKAKYIVTEPYFSVSLYTYKCTSLYEYGNCSDRKGVQCVLNKRCLYLPAAQKSPGLTFSIFLLRRFSTRISLLFFSFSYCLHADTIRQQILKENL